MKIRIEDLTQDVVKGMTDQQLFDLRLRTLQVWRKNFEGNSLAIAAGLHREDFLQYYDLLRREMERRDLKPTWDSVDTYLLRRKMMQGLDPASIGDIVLKSGFVSLAGEFLSDPKGANFCDLYLTEGAAQREKDALNVALTAQVGKPLRFHKTEDLQDNAEVLPLFDLALRPRITLKKVLARDVKSLAGDVGELYYCVDCATTVMYLGACPDCGGELTSEVPIWKASENELVVAKPGFEETENEIRYRIRDPERFQQDSFRRIALQQSKPRVYGIIGRLQGETTTTLQALRFPKEDGWTIPKARTWVKGHSDVLKKGYNFFEERKVIRDVGSEMTHLDSHREDAGVGEHEKKEARFSIYKIDEQEQVVGGVVYEPGVEDAQGDYTTSEEIWKAMIHFMENSQNIKLMHKGRPIEAYVIESYQAPDTFLIGNQRIRKGSWWLSVKVHDNDVWAEVKTGTITGFSMGGYARAD